MSKRPYAAALEGASKAAKLADYKLHEVDHTSEAYEASEFGGFSDYMRRKKLKLQDQDAQFRAQADPNLPKIFSGMVLHINGYTKPGRLELWKLIVAHGGVFKQYLENKTDITHIICSNLTRKKEQEFSKYRVVRPEWITDSITAGKALAWTDYMTILPEAPQRTMARATENITMHLAAQEADPAKFNSYKRVTAANNHQKCVNEPAQPDRSHGVKTATHPDFISDYYSKSRLHHLSAWKADLRLKVHNLQSHNPSRIQKIVMHIDFDCFFAAVALRDRPDLAGKPAAVAHGGSNSGEIASCNYKAREYGVKNGMWMKDAMPLCPELISLPYHFAAYEEVSNQFYEVLIALNAACLEAVSIDEALVDITNLLPCDYSRTGDLHTAATQFAEGLRKEIFGKTGCQVSVGIGNSILQAKLATKLAKPAGHFVMTPATLGDVLSKLTPRDLPGIGYATAAKISEATGAETLPQLQAVPDHTLRDLLGPNLGVSVYRACRGEDDSLVGNLSDRKLVSIEINWGIRFTTSAEVRDFLTRVAKELHDKLTRAGFASAQHISVKVMRRAADASIDPPKFLGHGKCDKVNASREIAGTNDTHKIAQHSIGLLESLKIPPDELRGIGVALTKLSVLRDTKQRNMSDFLRPEESAEDPIRTKSALDNARSPIQRELHFLKQDTAEIRNTVPLAKSVHMPATEITKERKILGFAHATAVPDSSIPREMSAHIRRESLKNAAFQAMDFAQKGMETPAVDLALNEDVEATNRTVNLPWVEAAALSDLGLSSLQETKNYINTWMTLDAPHGPDQADMQDFTDYMLYLTQDGDLEKVEAHLTWMEILARGNQLNWQFYVQSLKSQIRMQMRKQGLPSFKLCS